MRADARRVGGESGGRACGANDTARFANARSYHVQAHRRRDIESTKKTHGRRWAAISGDSGESLARVSERFACAAVQPCSAVCFASRSAPQHGCAARAVLQHLFADA